MLFSSICAWGHFKIMALQLPPAKIEDHTVGQGTMHRPGRSMPPTAYAQPTAQTG